MDIVDSENTGETTVPAKAGMGLVAREVVVGALLHFDQGSEATGVWGAAVALVKEEAHRYQPPKNSLSYLTAPDYSTFETDNQLSCSA